MQRLTSLRSQTEVWGELATQLEDLSGLLEMAREEGDEAVAADIGGTLRALEKQVEGLEFDLMLSGQYDSHDAIIYVHAREGGTDAQDWVQILVRIYVRWAQRRG